MRMAGFTMGHHRNIHLRSSFDPHIDHDAKHDTEKVTRISEKDTSEPASFARHQQNAEGSNNGGRIVTEHATGGEHDRAVMEAAVSEDYESGKDGGTDASISTPPPSLA